MGKPRRTKSTWEVDATITVDRGEEELEVLVKGSVDHECLGQSSDYGGSVYVESAVLEGGELPIELSAAEESKAQDALWEAARAAAEDEAEARAEARAEAAADDWD